MMFNLNSRCFNCNRYKFTLLIIITVILVSVAVADLYCNENLEVFRSLKNEYGNAEAARIARRAVRVYLKEQRTIEPPKTVPEAFNLPNGVFVTITKNGRVRGCMGTIQPATSSVAEEIIRSAILAATADPCHRPISSREVDQLKFTISIVGKLRRVESESELEPGRLGLLVRRGSRSALLLPGEALTARWQIYKCKLKAGIDQDKRVEMFVFPTVTLGDGQD